MTRVVGRLNHLSFISTGSQQFEDVNGACTGDDPEGKVEELTTFVDALKQFEEHILKPANENTSFLDFCQTIGYVKTEFPACCFPPQAKCKNYEAVLRVLLKVCLYLKLRALKLVSQA